MLQKDEVVVMSEQRLKSLLKCRDELAVFICQN